MLGDVFLHTNVVSRNVKAAYTSQEMSYTPHYRSRCAERQWAATISFLRRRRRTPSAPAVNHAPHVRARLSDAGSSPVFEHRHRHEAQHLAEHVVGRPAPQPQLGIQNQPMAQRRAHETLDVIR